METKEHKQRLIDIFVNAVYLYDDKLVITFNYKEASKTVTLKEVNGSIIECSGAPRRRELCTVRDDFFVTENPRAFPCEEMPSGLRQYDIRSNTV